MKMVKKLKKIKIVSLWKRYFILLFYLGSYPSPILQYNLQPRDDNQNTSNETAQNNSKKYIYEGK